MEHTVYLAAKAFIEAVKLRVPKNKISTTNGTASVEDDDDDDDVDVDDNTWTTDWVEPNSIPGDNEVDNVVEFSPGDVLGKALALVNQVCFYIIAFLLLVKKKSDPCITSSKSLLC